MKDWLIKKEAETDPEYGCQPHERDIKNYINNGILILDKPAGPTSHQVAAWVKEILHIKKVGHSGTLDPGVTGVLPVTISNATKIIQAMITAQKEYVCLMRLHKEVDEKKISETVKKFTGKILQKPPLKSAVKKVEREREVYYFNILEIDGQDVLFRIGTEAGTYIRKICTDFGKELGIKAHMQELRRTKAGSFTEEKTIILHDLKDAYEFWKEDKDEKHLREIIKPLEFGVNHLNKIIVKDSAIGAICHGAALHVGGISKLNKEIKENEMIAILSLKGELVALGTSKMDSKEMFNKRKGIGATINRVIMERNVYPKVWKNV